MVHKMLPHIIHRQIFDLTLRPPAIESDIQERLKNTFYDALPRMEEVFSLYNDPDRLIRIDKISLDLGVVNPEKLGDIFSSRLCDALAKVFRDSINISAKGNKTKPDNRLDTTPAKNEPVEWIDQFPVKTFAESEVNKIEYYSAEEGIRQAFFYFLTNGVFPWWMSQSNERNKETVFSLLLDQPTASFIETLWHLLAKDSNVLKRMLYQFPETFIDRLFFLFKQQVKQEVLHLYENLKNHHFFGNKQIASSETLTHQDNWLSFKILMTNNTTEAVNMLTQHLAQLLKNDDTTVETIISIIKTDPWLTYQQEILQKLNAIIPADNSVRLTNTSGLTEADSYVVSLAKDQREDRAHKPDEEITDDEPIDEFMFVDYAGLVILHPFLTQFFAGLGLLDDQHHFINERSRTRAVHLLAFLASGEMNTHETKLPFCKFLCGMPVKIAIIKNISTSANDIKECEGLLEAVISHWTALKNTSSAGLREAFLQRKGKLDFRESDPVLFVEGRAHDILLERLPWGISFIHLPWIDKPLTTIWN